MFGRFRAKKQEKNLDDLREKGRKRHQKKGWFTQKAEAIVDTFSVDPHRKMERKFVSYIMAFMIFITGVGLSVTHIVHVNNVKQMTVDGAGTTKTFSRSGSNITLLKSHVSSDGETAYIPFEMTDFGKISVNTEHFRVGIHPNGHGKLTYVPSGQFVLFGSSGDGVIILHDKHGIMNEPLNIFIRNTRQLSSSYNKQADSDTDDAVDSGNSQQMKQLEQKYDLLNFSVNPGSKNAVKQYKVNYTVHQPLELYKILFAYQKEFKIKKAIKHDLKAADNNVELANEYRSRLETDGFDVPADPKWVKKSWRPFDAFDWKTHKLANGKSVDDMSSNSGDTTNDPNDDPDKSDYPDTLKGKDGQTMNSNSGSSQGGLADQNNNQSGNDSDDDNSTSPATLWQQLTAAWDQVKQLKRDAYVTQPIQLYQAQQDAKRQAKGMSYVGSPNVTVRGKVKIENTKPTKQNVKVMLQQQKKSK